MYSAYYLVPEKNITKSNPLLQAGKNENEEDKDIENLTEEDKKQNEIIKSIFKIQRSMIKQKPKKTKKYLQKLVDKLTNDTDSSVLKINGKQYVRKAII